MTYLNEKTHLVVADNTIKSAILSHGLTITKPQGSAKGTYTVLSVADGACTNEDLAAVTLGEGLEGEKVWERSVVATSLNAFQQFVGEAKLRKGGKYTLEFYAPQPEYIENAENNLNSVLDNVSLEYSRKIPGFMLIVR